MLLELLAILVAIGFSAIALTQLTIPAWRGRPLFPMLRRSNRMARQKVADAADDVALAEAELEAARLRARARASQRVAEQEELSEFDEQIQEAKRKQYES